MTTQKAAATTNTGRKAWVKKTPVEVVLEQIGKQEEKVAGMREELTNEERELPNCSRPKRSWRRSKSATTTRGALYI